MEKLTCTFNSSGYLQASQIDGAIVVSNTRRLMPLRPDYRYVMLGI